MRIEDDTKLDFSDVLIKPKRSTLRSRKQVDLVRTFKFRNSTNTWTGIPIMASNMDTVGTFAMFKSLSKEQLFTCVHKYYTEEDWENYIPSGEVFIPFRGNMEYIAPSIGANYEDLDLFYKLYEKYKFRFLCIDVANGYGEYFPRFIEEVRGANPTLTIIAGNVATPEMTEQLILSGADIVKIGIGPGSVCTTRIQTGVGYPQLSAIAECSDVAHGLDGHVVADGGCTCPGDIAKAFGAGADFVMLGGMLAGHREGVKPGSWNFGSGYNPPDAIPFYGMSSKVANEKHNGGLKEYRSAEGKEVMIPYKGEVANTIQDILGGLRST
jgi:GMP reductase